MRKTILLLLLTAALGSHAQTSREDSILNSITDYEEFFNELESFIDSITAPRSFTTVNAGLGYGFFNYYNEGTGVSTIRKNAVLSPSFGYYDKDGLGFSANGSAVLDGEKILPYQLAATAFYDYLQNRRFMAGFSYSHIFTRDSLPFYTSPLNNELNAYFTYRKWWLRPAVTVNYGWGSRRTVEERKTMLAALRLPVGSTTTETVETVNDLTITASIKHDFYWLDVLGKKDFFRLSPQFSVVAGTQRFGFNQTENSFLSGKKSGRELLYQSRSAFVNYKTDFQPLSASFNLKAEWSKGIFFVQPQFFIDYLFGTEHKKLITAQALNAGIIF
jgi:hypothetical protein